MYRYEDSTPPIAVQYQRRKLFSVRSTEVVGDLGNSLLYIAFCSTSTPVLAMASPATAAGPSDAPANRQDLPSPVIENDRLVALDQELGSNTTPAPTDPIPSVPVCGHCTKPSAINEDGEPTIKACNKCHSVWYCNKDCQKSDFKAHKKVCAALAQSYAASHEPSRAASRAAPKKSSGQRGLQKWQFDT